MQLPKIAFQTQQCNLYESDFEISGCVKPLRIIQFMQDVATTHGEILGVGWHTLNENNLLWVLGKVKISFHKKIDRTVKSFTLYTWPLAPTRFFAERCFCAVDEQGQQLFSATSLWVMIDRNSRKMVSAETMNNFYHGQYSDAHCDTPNTYARVKFDETFTLAYTQTVRRSDLDLNGHVNNTNYVTYATDVLTGPAEVRSLEIVYHRELKLGDTFNVYAKQDGNVYQVVGKTDETCFTAVLETK